MFHNKGTTTLGLSSLLLMAVILAGVVSGPHTATAQQAARLFPETGKSVSGRFLEYWDTHGGLAQQGYPISDVMGGVSPTDGKLYTVQYFERAVFEYHPENQPPYDVLLSLLGASRYRQKYLTGAPGQRPSASPGNVWFEATGKRVGGGFLAYWQQHGGLAQQGYPISDVFQEKSDLDGKLYTVQYFERAVFEGHYVASQWTVLLSQLGTFGYKQLSIADRGVAAPFPVPPALPTPTATPTRTPDARATAQVATATAQAARFTPTPRPRPTATPLPGELTTDDKGLLQYMYDVVEVLYPKELQGRLGTVGAVGNLRFRLHSARLSPGGVYTPPVRALVVWEGGANGVEEQCKYVSIYSYQAACFDAIDELDSRILEFVDR